MVWYGMIWHVRGMCMEDFFKPYLPTYIDGEQDVRYAIVVYAKPFFVEYVLVLAILVDAP